MPPEALCPLFALSLRSSTMAIVEWDFQVRVHFLDYFVAVKQREEEWVLPKLKKLKGSKDCSNCFQTHIFLEPS